jgi:hypothetical protein
LHIPQFDALEARSASQPFAALLSQFEKPALHAPIAHWEFAQVAPAWANEQTNPQAPQFAALFAVSTSQPSTFDRLQSAKAP